LSNGDDKIPVRAAISAIKANLPCNKSDCSHAWYYEDFPNNKGFRRIRECSSINPWNPIAMIDQHVPILHEIENEVRGIILSWTHIMLKLAEKFKAWDVPKLLRYPIAMGFKIVGRSRSDEEADDLMKLFKNFIDALAIEETNYYYVKRINETSLTFTSPYDGKQIQLDANAMESLKPMINSFTNRQGVVERKGDKIFDPPTSKDFCRDPLRNFKSKRRNSVKPNGPSKPNKRVRTKEINIGQQIEFSDTQAPLEEVISISN
ncbi:16474_t:CDS:2, partial [Cetraspora pellucida]